MTVMTAWQVSSENTDTFEAVEVDLPTLRPRDVLVKVQAISMNPVDTKVRAGRAGQILGWDASGTVVEVGEKVTRLQPGDEVYYAGDIQRPGTNSQFHAVDERIVGLKPESLSHAEAASLPLTALTAWEALYEQMRIKKGQTLLVIAGAGGVGSIAIQLANQLSGSTVIATASREASADWATSMGASHIINHREDMPAQLRELGFEGVDAILCCHDTTMHFDAMAEMIAPQGSIGSIVEASDPLPIGKLMSKKVRFSWELMFTKSMFETPDMDSQSTILNDVAKMVDAGTLRHTAQGPVQEVSAQVLTEAHKAQASGSSIGKRVYTISH